MYTNFLVQIHVGPILLTVRLAPNCKSNKPPNDPTYFDVHLVVSKLYTSISVYLLAITMAVVAANNSYD